MSSEYPKDVPRGLPNRKPREGMPDSFAVAAAVSEALKTTQFKFRLSNALNERIEEAASRDGCNASEEIRRRLVASFVQESRAGDDETFRLIEAIKTVAQNLEGPFGSWHKDRFAFDVFVEAVNVVMALYRPPGESVRPSDNEIADLYLGTAGTPETAGRMLAGGAAAAANIPMPGARKEGESARAGRKQ